MSRALFWIALVTSSLAAVNSVQCLGQNGSPVDWWFIYKMPENSCSGVNCSLRFAYMDPSSTASTLSIVEGTTLGAPGGALGGTLAQIYDAKSGDEVGYAAYNDEKPESNKLDLTTSSVFHAKGVVATDTSTGFFLTHTVPKFPDFSLSSFSWTASQIYGQSFLCVTFDAAEIDAVAAQLQYYKMTSIYASSVSSAIAAKVPHLQALVELEKPSGDSSITTVTSAGGVQFISFAKSKAWGKDLGEDLVSPYFNSSFLWETWRRSPAEASYCSSSGYAFDSINVENISVGTAEENAFRYTKDHSKWGVSLEVSEPWVCESDINRMTSQQERGGGCLCIKHSQLHAALTAAVSGREACDQGSVSAIRHDSKQAGNVLV